MTDDARTRLIERLEKLREFALWALDGYKTGVVGDLDGGALEDCALQFGLLTESGGEDPNYFIAGWLQDANALTTLRTPAADTLAAWDILLSSIGTEQKASPAECALAFLRVYSDRLKKGDPWDIPETMGGALEQAADTLDEALKKQSAAQEEKS